jgi:phenylalanyl-tRNA synthetase beta chain
MILEICGGEPSHSIAAGKTPEWRRTIAFDPMRVASLTGLEVSKDEVVRTLTKLGFEVDAKDSRMAVAPPSWRPDVQGPADLVEEVVRISGLDKLPSTPLPRTSAVTKPVLTTSQRRVRDAKRTLAARGFVETVNDSFVPRAHAKLFGGGGDELQIANPISAELDAMRPSVLPSLLAAASRNQARGFKDVLFFEVGPQFSGGAPGEQLVVATGIRKGAGQRHWSGKPPAPDVFAAKADAIALLDALGAPTTTVQITPDAPAWYHPGRSGVMRLGPKNLMAVFGEIHPKILGQFDLEGPVSAFEVVLDSIPSPKQKATKEKPPLVLSDYPAVERDFAFVVDSKVTAADIVKAAQGVDRVLIESISVFDVYEGKGIDPGKKSIAIAVRLQPKDKTMTDDDIKSVSDKIVAAVIKATGAVQRA